jgi:hypothetical protein
VKGLRISFVTALLIGVLALPQASHAGKLGTNVVALFPKEVGEFAYADLKKARQLKWFKPLEDQMLPGRLKEFERFLSSAGVDPNSQVDELAWAIVNESTAAAKRTDREEKDTAPAAGGEQLVGVALGTFNPGSTADFYASQKFPVTKIHGYSLYAFGNGAGAGDLLFFFIDSNTAAFGHRGILEKLIGVRFGEEESLLRNEKLFPLINEANSGGVVWAVLNPFYTRMALSQLAPEVSQFPEAAKLTSRMKSLILNFDANSGVDGHFQAICGSVEDANTLSALVQAGFLYRRYQEGKSNPDLAQLFDQARVSAKGDRLDLRMSLSDDQMATLIRKNTFAFKM